MSKQAKPRNVVTLLNRAKLVYLSSIGFHIVLRTHCLATRTVWNIIDDRYPSVSNVATFGGLLVLTYSLATRTVWNIIDGKYSHFCFPNGVSIIDIIPNCPTDKYYR